MHAKKRRSAIESYVRDVPPTRALRRPTRPYAHDRSSFERHITTTFVRTTRSHAQTGASGFVARARRRGALPCLSSFDRGAPLLFARSQTGWMAPPQLDTGARQNSAHVYHNDLFEVRSGRSADGRGRRGVGLLQVPIIINDEFKRGGAGVIAAGGGTPCDAIRRDATRASHLTCGVGAPSQRRDEGRRLTSRR